MKPRTKHFTVFEYQSLWTHKGDQWLSDTQLLNLQSFYGEKGVPYYTLIHKGVRFCEYVGVLQIGDLTIEVLPKADRYSDTDSWRKILIGMLRSVGAFNIQAPSQSALNIKSNYILDLYFELFIRELEYLLHRGLIKKYRRTERNQLALKGSLKFAQHLSKNLVHKERFYTTHSIYDSNHLLNQIIYKTLLLVKRINNNLVLNSRVGALLMDIPEMSSIKVTPATFNKIVLNRKSEAYKNILEISKLLLLNYHPDLSSGKHIVLALLFDMNALWEQFIVKSLQKKLANGQVRGQVKKNFWKPAQGRKTTMRPDIVICLNNGKRFVLDTKWKNIKDKNPSPDDLRQLYVYQQYFEADKVALVYPGEFAFHKGLFYNTSDNMQLSKACGVLKIPTNALISDWQIAIHQHILDWMEG